jgi:hypothetical protein
MGGGGVQVTAEPAPTAPVLPAGQQPALQLSLDVVMQENYLGDLRRGQCWLISLCSTTTSMRWNP